MSFILLIRKVSSLGIVSGSYINVYSSWNSQQRSGYRKVLVTFKINNINGMPVKIPLGQYSLNVTVRGQNIRKLYNYYAKKTRRDWMCILHHYYDIICVLPIVILKSRSFFPYFLLYKIWNLISLQQISSLNQI